MTSKTFLNTILYNSVLLDKESKELLLKKFPPKHPKVFAEHCTLEFKPNDLPKNLGEKVELEVIGYAEDDKGQAIVVKLQSGIVSNNKVPHITISVVDKPFYSNELVGKGYQEIVPFKLFGTIAANIEGKNVTRIPKLLLTLGIPGSGKSFWVNSLKGFEIVNPDNIRKELTGNISDQTQNAKVWAIASKRVIENLKAGKNVVLDATNVTEKGRNQFLRNILREIVFKKQAKVFEIDPEEAKKRIKADILSGKDRSNVPDEVVDRMFQQFKQSVGNLGKEGFEVI